MRLLYCWMNSNRKVFCFLLLLVVVCCCCFWRNFHYFRFPGPPYISCFLFHYGSYRVMNCTNPMRFIFYFVQVDRTIGTFKAALTAINQRLKWLGLGLVLYAHHVVAVTSRWKGWRKEAVSFPPSRSGTSCVNQTSIGDCSRAAWRRLLRDGSEHVWTFPSSAMPFRVETVSETETPDDGWSGMTATWHGHRWLCRLGSNPWARDLVLEAWTLRPCHILPTMRRVKSCGNPRVREIPAWTGRHSNPWPCPWGVAPETASAFRIFGVRTDVKVKTEMSVQNADMVISRRSWPIKSARHVDSRWVQTKVRWFCGPGKALKRPRSVHWIVCDLSVLLNKYGVF